MKLTHLPRSLPQATAQMLETVSETVSEIGSEWRKQKLPLYLFLALCFNVLLAPAVFAATGGDLSRTQAYWLGALVLLTIGLAIYLCFVMFVPERF